MEAKFRELEEANLFSIQQLQETESKLDQLRRAHDELKQSMGRQITTVDAQLKVLQEGLEAQKRKNAQLGAGGIRSELKEIDPRRLLRRCDVTARSLSFTASLRCFWAAGRP